MTDNIGNWNIGIWNIGHKNLGESNTGSKNNGACNSGDCNNGVANSGNCNLGNWNAGNNNLGGWNSGDSNEGDWNTGNWNSGNYNNGCFNTNEPKARFFNQECEYTLSELRNNERLPHMDEFQLTEWIESKDMTIKEKEENPSYEVTGGYLRQYAYKEAWKNFWEKTDKENKEKFLNLPNFNNSIFEQITGIKVILNEENNNE